MTYDQVLALRDDNNDAHRGYAFEHAIREILPWTTRPPIAVTADSEQMDAFFEWNGWHFLVECKAKKGKILLGSHDWEDFELKLQKRKGNCFGIFCSLGPVDDRVFENAEQLNRANRVTIVIAGDTWDDLQRERLPLEDFLRYMVMFAKAKFIGKPPRAAEIKAWKNDRQQVTIKINRLALQASSLFLRRHRMDIHTRLYVPRDIDCHIDETAALLRPSRMRLEAKNVVREDTEYSKQRKAPPQIIIVKDMSGSGKTTLTVQTTVSSEGFFGIARAALEAGIDNLGEVLSKIGPDYGLNELATVDRPIVYAVDSLDEAVTIAHKRDEIRALLQLLRDLNRVAASYGYNGFPILLVFTVREEFWREWESLFEGREVKSYLRRFSYFTPSETKVALKNYSSAYSYELAGALGAEDMKVLSHPFSLQIFSEANKYAGLISTASLLNEDVLFLYFDRKKEDVLKRPIAGFYGDTLLRVCSVIAADMVSKRRNGLRHSEVSALVGRTEPLLSPSADSITNSIVSEQILSRDSENAQVLRFRHARFLEYLFAYHVCRTLHTRRKQTVLDELTSSALQSGFISIYNLHDFIRHICVRVFPDSLEFVTQSYARSEPYMARLIQVKRLDLAMGSRTVESDLDAIEVAMAGPNAEICWEAFFVLAARANGVERQKLVEGFRVAWDKNKGRPDRWKLLTKLAFHGALLEENVISRVVHSAVVKEWQVYLEEVNTSSELHKFPEAWCAVGGGDIRREICEREDSAWKAVSYLLAYVAEGKRYPLGSVEAAFQDGNAAPGGDKRGGLIQRMLGNLRNGKEG